jgi:hypothetical protein
MEFVVTLLPEQKFSKIHLPRGTTKKFGQVIPVIKKEFFRVRITMDN